MREALIQAFHELACGWSYLNPIIPGPLPGHHCSEFLIPVSPCPQTWVPIHPDSLLRWSPQFHGRLSLATCSSSLPPWSSEFMALGVYPSTVIFLEFQQ